jgi:hypothetical protein
MNDHANMKPCAAQAIARVGSRSWERGGGMPARIGSIAVLK